MNRTTITCAILLIIFFLPRMGMAHAFLDHAEPRVGAEVDQPPTEIKIWFSEDVEPAFSSLVVRDSSGNQVDSKDTHQDAKDKKLLIVSVPKLATGQYKVTWSVVASDTHHTRGDFKFTVKARN